MTKEEIVIETVLYYNKDPNKRIAYENGDCCYISNSGQKCAVGRCAIDPSSFEQGSIYEQDLSSKELDKKLKSQYRGHDLYFWSSLQGLHDDTENWNSGLNRISARGVQYVQDTFNIDLTKYLTSDFKNKK
jgi:hypothetical protein